MLVDIGKSGWGGGGGKYTVSSDQMFLVTLHVARGVMVRKFLMEKFFAVHTRTVPADHPHE